MGLTVDGGVTWQAIKPLRLIGSVLTAINTRSFVANPLSLPALALPGNEAIVQIRNNVPQGCVLEFDDGINTVSVPFYYSLLGTPNAINFIRQVVTGSNLKYTVTQPNYNTLVIVNNSGQQGNIVQIGDNTIPQAILITNFAGADASGAQSGYLDGGTLTWITGYNAGVSIEIKTYVANGSVVTTWLGLNYAPQPGDTFFYYPGCDKRRESCFQKFNNILNFRGEPDMPGMDQMLSYPDAP